MNAEAPTLDLAECQQFISFWCKVTSAPHITLTAIVPDGATTTATFPAADSEKANKWIAWHQNDGQNIYFQVNETPARCAKKPTKAMMQAALCRHADIDPLDKLYPYQEERNRLHQLADFLRADPVMPPTAILDSGNGIQPLWAAAREPLTPEVIDRVEAENRAIEAATGAKGTHNIDRLLRLPGTLNFPNALKRKLNRGVGRARLLLHADSTYTTEQAAGLGAHLQKLLSGSDLVRLPPEPDAAAHLKEKTGDRDERPKASDPRDSEPPKGDDKPKADTADILTRLNQASTFHRDVQAAIAGACTLKGGSRSEGAFGLGAGLKRLGWRFEDMKAALLACPATREWAAEQQGDGDRQFRRIWDRSTEQDTGEAKDTPPFDPPPDCIDGEWWLTRVLERPTPVLGEVICTTTRMLLGGPTGVGKTHVAMGMAGAIATGGDFLHWAGPSKPLVVLFIDGEMARDLIQDRMHDLKRRLADASLEHFHMLCREDFPAMHGLNTPAGQAFLLKKIEDIKPAVVFLDNRMSLLVGDMKDEAPWTETMPLVLALTRQRVAQVWIDHMGHETDRIYGSKTKEWQMDVVAAIKEAEADAPDGADIHVALKFSKARRRRPETRGDFSSVTITLMNDKWTSEPDLLARVPKKAKGLPADADQFHAALLDAIVCNRTGPGQTSRKTWMAECRRVGLLEEPHPEADWQQRDKLAFPFRKALSVLKRLKMVGVNGDTCSDLTQRYGCGA